MKKLIFIFLLLFSTTVSPSNYLKEDIIKEKLIQSVINQCNQGLEYIKDEITVSKINNDITYYKYLIWYYESLKAQCEYEIQLIEQGYYQ